MHKLTVFLVRVLHFCCNYSLAFCSETSGLKMAYSCGKVNWKVILLLFFTLSKCCFGISSTAASHVCCCCCFREDCSRDRRPRLWLAIWSYDVSPFDWITAISSGRILLSHWLIRLDSIVCVYAIACSNVWINLTIYACVIYL